MYYRSVVFYTLLYTTISLLLPERAKEWLKNYIETKLPMMEK